MQSVCRILSTDGRLSVLLRLTQHWRGQPFVKNTLLSIDINMVSALFKIRMETLYYYRLPYLHLSSGRAWLVLLKREPQVEDNKINFTLLVGRCQW